MKAALIKEFYQGLPKDRLKLETHDHGFKFLEEMLSDGMRLEYGEMVLLKTIHKYKFASVPDNKFDALLEAHVQKRCNVCLYFKEDENSLFAFNLDKDQRFADDPSIPELLAAVNLLRETLSQLGCEPLVILSGKGYHLWCRLDSPVSNDTLYDFMVRAMAKALFQLHNTGLNHQRIYTRFYPDPRTLAKISLRLFGSEHMSNRQFSQVVTGQGMLDEDASWAAFETHLKTKTISTETFQNAHATLRRQ